MSHSAALRTNEPTGSQLSSKKYTAPAVKSSGTRQANRKKWNGRASLEDSVGIGKKGATPVPATFVR